ncbi:uncharacterized protein LTR77_000451 [Saxophila tyrrhenica]|uniref:Ferritin-like domain-containing protein n=1 Tax=Saxophila tyrrhenica TaxID=1690608 RepID=A0AAV9PSK2_9PEZI|nr:hypothetical protein LTR77_000451 [Saxophila tyrrhenica]
MINNIASNFLHALRGRSANVFRSQAICRNLSSCVKIILLSDANMRTAAVLSLLAAADLIAASPLQWLWLSNKRQVESQMNDVDILRYALTLEHLEDKFYREGLANFTKADFRAAGYDNSFYKNVKAISAHETAHVEFLTAGLEAAGVKPVAECKYAFGIDSVDAFVATASVLEGVGTSAYLGAAKQISNKAYLTAAGSILTVEARHSAYLRANLPQSPFAQSQDNPLTPDEVHTMASGFIVSCPKGNPTFPIKAFPGLTVTTTGKIRAGDQITLVTNRYVLAAGAKGAKLHAVFVTANGPVHAQMKAKKDGMTFTVTIPERVHGQSYLLLSNCDEAATSVPDETVVAGPTYLEIK